MQTVTNGGVKQCKSAADSGNGVSNQQVRERQIAASSENLTFLDPDLHTGFAKPKIKFVIHADHDTW